MGKQMPARQTLGGGGGGRKEAVYMYELDRSGNRNLKE